MRAHAPTSTLIVLLFPSIPDTSMAEAPQWRGTAQAVHVGACERKPLCLDIDCDGKLDSAWVITPEDRSCRIPTGAVHIAEWVPRRIKPSPAPRFQWTHFCDNRRRQATCRCVIGGGSGASRSALAGWRKKPGRMRRLIRGARLEVVSRNVMGTDGRVAVETMRSSGQRRYRIVRKECILTRALPRAGGGAHSDRTPARCSLRAL